jgi:hypothetical protein
MKSILFKRYNFWLVTSLFLVLSGCKDKFLEEIPKTTLTTDVYYKTEAGFEDLVRSCYPLLRNIHQNRILVLNGTDIYNKDDKIILTFDGVVQKGSGFLKFYQTDGLALSATASGAASVQVSGNTVTVLGSTSILHKGTDYGITIDTGMFIDSSGNSIQGISNKNQVIISNIDGNNYFLKDISHVNTHSELATGIDLNPLGQSIGLHYNNGSLDFSVADNAANDTIYRIYQAAFARSPDKAGFVYWTNEATSKNLDSLTIANAFTHSQEFQQKFGTNPSNTEYITKLYENVLGRAPDQDGLNYWVHQADSGRSDEQLLVDFANSPENVQLTGIHTTNGYWTT